MGKWNKALKQGLVAAVVFGGVLMGSMSQAEAQTAEQTSCESYRNAKALCEVGSNNPNILIPMPVLSDYSSLMKLQERYLESIEAMRTAGHQHKSSADKTKKSLQEKKTAYELCKTVLNHKLAARNFHHRQGQYCKQRAEVCEQRCGGKEKRSCYTMRTLAEWTLEMSDLHTDSAEIQVLKNCMLDHDIDDQILTASIPKVAPQEKTQLPQLGPLPMMKPRTSR